MCCFLFVRLLFFSFLFAIVVLLALPAVRLGRSINVCASLSLSLYHSIMKGRAENGKISTPAQNVSISNENNNKKKKRRRKIRERER